VCVVLGFVLRAYSHSTSPFLWCLFFKIGSHELFVQASFKPWSSWFLLGLQAWATGAWLELYTLNGWIVSFIIISKLLSKKLSHCQIPSHPIWLPPILGLLSQVLHGAGPEGWMDAKSSSQSPDAAGYPSSIWEPLWTLVFSPNPRLSDWSLLAF
jgi:hypothetical protein